MNSLPLLQRRLAGGILSGGSGLARMVSSRFPQVGGGEGIILKSMRDLDLDGSVSLVGGTTGSAGGGREEGVVVVTEGEALMEEEVEEATTGGLEEEAELVGGATSDDVSGCDWPPDTGCSWPSFVAC